MKYKSDFLNEIDARGFIYQSSDIEDLDIVMSKRKIVAYIGFDPTSDSLHIGSLVQLMLLNWLENYGHKPIALMGGGTTLVGDPSGKDESRKIIQQSEIENNISKIKSSFLKFVDLNKNAKIINNHDWLKKINYIDFLRDIGQKITINQMMTFESVKSRLDRQQPLSFLEFNYMLLQAYDYMHLNKEYNCELQLGGSDQWGNILSGINLIRKTSNKKTYAITSPLITNSDGSKMGKTVDGAIWLEKNKLDNFKFFQFWRNINDNDVSKFLKLFTKVSLEEIKKLSELKDKETNIAKKILAFEVTKICRGEESAKEAMEISNNIFDKNIIDKRIISINIRPVDLKNDTVTIIDVLEKLNLVESRGDAKRIIKSNGVKINDTSYENDSFSLKKFSDQKELKISVGKKKIGLIKIQ
jgi:tyrosyl-tRNA synthetase